MNDKLELEDGDVTTMQCPHCLGARLKFSKNLFLTGGVLTCPNCGRKSKIFKKTPPTDRKTTKKRS